MINGLTWADSRVFIHKNHGLLQPAGMTLSVHCNILMKCLSMDWFQTGFAHRCMGFLWLVAIQFRWLETKAAYQLGGTSIYGIPTKVDPEGNRHPQCLKMGYPQQFGWGNWWSIKSWGTLRYPIWLVVSTPLKNMSSSVGMMIPNI
jgi:hypothetical protein